MTAPHPDDELVDLALGHVAAERRSVLAEHLLACPRCRRTHDDLVAAVEAVAVAVPPVQPPLGFDERVLGRAGAVTPPAAGPRSRRWLPVAAAVVLVALALGAVGGGWWAGRDDPAGTADRVAALTAGDRDVGSATVTEVGGEPVLVVGLTTGRGGVAYICRMRFADGSTLDTDPWAAAPGAGWLVPLPTDRGALTGIELRAPGAGAVWSTADLG